MRVWLQTSENEDGSLLGVEVWAYLPFEDLKLGRVW